ncbi:MAG: DUF211 domain-containing protein [Salinigranum sp.]
MQPVRRLVVDLLKPHDPRTVEFTRALADVDGVEALNATLIETDREVQNLKLTVEGTDVDYEGLEETVRDLGGSVHSVDQVVVGEYLLEAQGTPQD